MHSNDFDLTPPADNLEEALQLVSRQFDGDLDVSDLARLEELETRFAAEVSQFRCRCLVLRQSLRELPVRVVPGIVSHRPAVSTIEAVKRTSLPNRRFFLAMSGFATVLCGCLLIIFLRPDRALDDQSALLVSRQLADVAPMAKGRSLQVDEAGASDLQLLLASENWNIVVVRVDEKDRTQAMRQIESIARDHGLQLDDARGNDKADWLGVVLTSAVADRDNVVNEMERKVGEVFDASDSQMIGNVDRRDIVDAVRKSFESPTQSELYHGRVFLALPATDGTPTDSEPISDQDLLARNDSLRPQKRAASGDGPFSPGAGGSSAEGADSATAEDSVILVVVEFVSDRSESNRKI